MKCFSENTKATKNHKGTRRGNRRLRRLEPIRGRLPPAKLPEWEPQISEEHRVAQRIQRVTETGGVLAHAGLPVYFQITKDTKDTKEGDAGGRAVRAHKAHVRPGGPVGHGGLRTPCFCFRNPTGLTFHKWPFVTPSPRRGVLFSVLCSPGRVSAPCPISPTAASFWHVADVPGVQGQLEAWKFGGLALSLAQTLRPSRACRAFRFPFSGAAQAAPSNQPISQSPNQLLAARGNGGGSRR